MRDKQKLRVNDPLDDAIGAADNRNIRGWISVAFGEKTEEYPACRIDAQPLPRGPFLGKQGVVSS
jgi:hypothetical protein